MTMSLGEAVTRAQQNADKNGETMAVYRMTHHLNSYGLMPNNQFEEMRQMLSPRRLVRLVEPQS